MEFHLKNAERIANLLDNKFKIGNFSFGLDPILGLFFGAGDMIGLVLSFYIVWIAWEYHVPNMVLVRMLFNIGIDFLVGLIPFVGDLLDFGLKANAKNMELLKAHVKSSRIEI